MATVVYDSTLMALQRFKDRGLSIEALASAIDALRANTDLGEFSAEVEDIYFLVEDVNAACANDMRAPTTDECEKILKRLLSLESIITSLRDDVRRNGQPKT